MEKGKDLTDRMEKGKDLTEVRALESLPFALYTKYATMPR
jgi:hypothetical protein